jgi:hypothetical protein
MKITSDIFDAYLKCSTKCWLRRAEAPLSSSTYTEWVKSQNEVRAGSGNLNTRVKWIFSLLTAL